MRGPPRTLNGMTAQTLLWVVVLWSLGGLAVALVLGRMIAVGQARDVRRVSAQPGHEPVPVAVPEQRDDADVASTPAAMTSADATH